MRDPSIARVHHGTFGCPPTRGEATARFGIELIAWHAASNHDHAVVYDPSGNLPLFLERFHKPSARALNARWKPTN